MASKKDKPSDEELSQKLAKTILALPDELHPRFNILKELADGRTEVEKKYEKEMEELDKKYDILYKILDTKRNRIVCGETVETTGTVEEEKKEEIMEESKDEETKIDITETAKTEETEGKLTAEDEKPKEDAPIIAQDVQKEESEKKMTNDDKIQGVADDNKKEEKDSGEISGKPLSEEEISKIKEGAGIPEFWLRVLENHHQIKTEIHAKDKPILKHLIDIRTELMDGKSFKLVFQFSENEYFTNEILSKEFIMNKASSDELESATGTEIQWIEGKNITVKQIKKKQKHKKTKKTRVVIKTVEAKSFFNFFKTHKMPEEEDLADMGSEEEDLLADEVEEDLELGEMFLEEIVPDAIFYYFGLIQAPDMDEDDMMPEEGSSDEEVEGEKQSSGKAEKQTEGEDKNCKNQ